MKSIFKSLVALLLLITMTLSILSCGVNTVDSKEETSDNTQTEQKQEEFYIEGPNPITMTQGESITLTVVVPDGVEGEIIWTSSSSCASVENGVVTALKEGTAVIKATLGEYSDRVVINVDTVNGGDNSDDNNTTDTPDNGDTDVDDDYVFGSEYPCITIAEALEIATEYTSSPSSGIYYIVATVEFVMSLSNGEMYIYDDTGSIYVYRSKLADGSSLSGSGIDSEYIVLISGTLRNYKNTLEIEKGNIIAYYNPETEEAPKPDQGGNGSGSGESNNNNPGDDVVIPGVNDPVQSDPYVNVNVDEFYRNYTPAISYMDAYYRTKHNLLSGTLADQDQAPSISSYRPTSDGKYIRNNVYIFSEDGNTYYVVDCYGEVAFEVYKGGAYVILEEVAAYVFAFGEPPANHSASKNTDPDDSVWGIYLRVNNTKFSGDTSKYP